ncbi:MAG: hypothetical protein Q7K54_05670 [Candidatus Parcubacteria bacterium]|nr:hypothetical protein [Candidatus Parcubacteria bacterium]
MNIENILNKNSIPYQQAGNDLVINCPFCNKILGGNPVATFHIDQSYYRGNCNSCSKIADWEEISEKLGIISEKENIEKEEKKTEEKEDKRERTSQSDQLVKLIENTEGIELFHDDLNEPHIRININGHCENWRCRSKQFKRYLSSLYWNSYKKAPNTDAINTALGVIEAKACFDGNKFELFNRVAWLNDSLWYDLTNNNWQAVKINSEKWEIVHEPPILFKHYNHQKLQITPEKNGSIDEIFKFINIQNENHRILLRVYIVSSFIPDFPHPILCLYGSQGSAKSTLSRLLKMLIDPSAFGVTDFPKDGMELAQKLHNQWFSFFDNVSYLSGNTSDILCRAVTGAGVSKRELYTDGDDIIYHIKRPIGLNGINLIINKPDLLERSLLIELQEIPDDQRKAEKEIMEEFEKCLPKILGSIFDILSKALKIRPAIKLKSMPRMADFALWGCAITEALGYDQNRFSEAYNENINKQNDEALYENPVAMALTNFMEDKEIWTGTSTKLLSEIKLIAQNLKIEEKTLPKAPNALSRILNQIKPNLKKIGIEIIKEDGKQRILVIQKTKNNIVNIVDDANAVSDINDKNDNYDNF